MRYRKTLLFLICLLIFAARTCWHGSEFCLHNIQSSLSYREDWATCDPDEHLQDAWNQPYMYLGNGAQCYAFVSQDGKYVLKFFKMKHLTPKSWLKAIPLIPKQYRFQKLNLRQQRLDQTFGAFKMAYDEFRIESGLLFVHLNRTHSLNKRALLQKGNKQWNVNLDEVPFILQERGELIYKHLNRLITEGDYYATQTAIRSVQDFFTHRNAKGFADLDSGISKNYGFVGNRVVQIDIGRLRHKKDLNEYEQALSRRGEEKFLQWAKQQQ